MVGIVTLNIVINAFIFSFVFWLLTFCGKFFYSNKYYNSKLNFYECGFKSLIKVQVSYSLNFLLLVLFLLLYDGEFLIVIPYSLNVIGSTFTNTLLLIYFLLWLQITLLLDYMFKALEWQV